MKKIIIFSLLIIVFFSVALKSYSFEPAPFKDVQASHYNAEAISYVKDNGIVKGYNDGTFRPDIKVNRAEFIKIIVGAKFGAEPISYASNCFPDVSAYDWFASYVCYAKKTGIISGYSDGQFKPNNNINLIEAVKILVNAFNIDIPDVKNSKLWYRRYIEAMQNKNYIPKTFSSLNQNVTRGEIAEMVWRTKKKITNRTSAHFDIIEIIGRPATTVVSSTSGSTSLCGDGTCQSSESCSACSSDCGSCKYCGDKICQSSETCSSCSSDCGACAPKSPVICHYKSDGEPIINQTTINLGDHQLAVKVYDEGDPDISQTAIETGFKILKAGLPIVESFFGETYPCDNLYINCKQESTGSTGEINISCVDAGLGDPTLPYHELTHSYWGSGNSPVWFAEGSARFMATFLIDKIEMSPPDFWPWNYFPISYNYHNLIETEGIDVSQKISEDLEYHDASNLGLLFLIDVYEIIGEDAMSNFYSDLYNHYLETGTKITRDDIASFILSNTPTDKRGAVEKLINDRLEQINPN